MRHFLIVVLAAALASCSNTAQQPQTAAVPQAAEHKAYPTAITVRAQGQNMGEMKFDTDKIIVNTGKPVTITLINEGNNTVMTHNLVIVHNGYAEEVAINGAAHKENGYVKPNDPAVIFASPMADPGKTVSLTFTMKEAGTYQFLCTYPGHWKQMSGYLVAVDEK